MSSPHTKLMDELQRLVLLSPTAVECFGNEAQELKAIEECGEFITAIMHFRKGTVDSSDVVHEAADVIITAMQIGLAYETERNQLNEELRLKLSNLVYLIKTAPVRAE